MGNCLVVSPSPSLPPLDKHENKNKENEAQIFKQISLPIQMPVELSNGAGYLLPAKQKKSGPENCGFENVMAVVPKNLEDLRQTGSYRDVTTFTYGEMRAATRNFRADQILGEGGFGVVYKGVIDDIVRSGFKTTQVAVKVLNREGLQGEKEWLTEVNYLGQLSHPHLVKLIGYCCEGTHRLLVYEYMASGSLESHLFRRMCLTLLWPTRVKIALGAAKGLAFLHDAERPIIYRDFKTSNILLDEEYNAKLSDFGLAKEGPMGDQTHVSTRVMGTYGYAAPEYVMTGHLTARSDVYGFGVVLLEMLIGRRAVDKSRPSREHNLVEWARPLLIHKKLAKIVDPRIEGQYTYKTLQKIANLAYHCLSTNPKGRPTMSEVVEILESLQNLPECSQDYLLTQSCRTTPFTLYEAEAPAAAVACKDSDKDKETASAAVVAQGGKKYERRAANGRSKSEPPTTPLLESPGSGDSPHHRNSTSTFKL